ncbi:hypothetical protein Q3G72_002586 [Acer saccharum]|nr:hypothetical protein Q3G72_002586 [Acer saccharum]
MENLKLVRWKLQCTIAKLGFWGADAQRRLSKSHNLVCGMKGTIAEFCKNIVLPGVGTLTLVDDWMVNEEALSANFWILLDEYVNGGKTISEVICQALVENFMTNLMSSLPVAALSQRKTITTQSKSLKKQLSANYSIQVLSFHKIFPSEGEVQAEKPEVCCCIQVLRNFVRQIRVNVSHFPDTLLERLVMSRRELSPVCALSLEEF